MFRRMKEEAYDRGYKWGYTVGKMDGERLTKAKLEASAELAALYLARLLPVDVSPHTPTPSPKDSERP